MQIIIPFKPRNPKSRLSNILNEKERENLAFYMLLDVIDVCEDAIILSSEECKRLEGYRVIVDKRSLDEAVTSFIKKGETAVVMSDLPLINKKILTSFLDSEGDVVIAPGRKAGTNMLLSRNRDFYTSYHYGSFLKHIDICRRLGLSYTVFDSFYSSVDIDEKEDLLELMIHGKGKKSYEYLKSLGFYVDFSEKDPKLRRA
uniref:2-phospho-L-lactate guanylyltransferase n=1 Tax=Geoglobus ahangari TaxID=113653 RepID=A0A7C3YFY1_9EURY